MAKLVYITNFITLVYNGFQVGCASVPNIYLKIIGL